MTDQANKEEATPLIKSRPAEETPVTEKSITEKQQESIPENMYWGAEFSLPQARFFMQAIEAQPDYKEKNWHFVPLKINEEFRPEHGGHKVLVHALCIADKDCLRRLKKFLAKYTTHGLEWKNIHENHTP